MSDIFSLKTVNMTPELGMALKNFRIENKKKKKSITEEFGKASSYISKLENLKQKYNSELDQVKGKKVVSLNEAFSYLFKLFSPPRVSVK